MLLFFRLHQSKVAAHTVGENLSRTERTLVSYFQMTEKSLINGYVRAARLANLLARNVESFRHSSRFTRILSIFRRLTLDIFQ